MQPARGLLVGSLVCIYWGAVFWFGVYRGLELAVVAVGTKGGGGKEGSLMQARAVQYKATPIRVLSLFDGISVGCDALARAAPAKVATTQLR